MPRTYSVSFENVAVTAAQDLAQIIGATGKICRILAVSVGATDTTLPTAQMVQLRCRFLPATVVNGTGGTAPTPRPNDPGDAVASFTAKVNSTGQATSNGTVTILKEWGVHLFSGLDYAFPRPPVIGVSESFVFELLSTVSGTVHLSGDVIVEEIGG